MKKFINNQKSLIMGVIIGLLITSFSFATNDQIQAVFGNFNLTINGQIIPLQTKPIVYNGTSYLPVREISNILGYDVDFDSGTQTIILDNQGGIIKQEPPKETTPINDIDNTNNSDNSDIKRIGETFNLGNDTTITVTGIDYKPIPEIDWSYRQDGNYKLLIVNFAIFTTATDEYRPFWRGIHFTGDVEYSNGSKTHTISPDENKIYPDTMTNTFILADTYDYGEPEFITFKHPLTEQNIKVSLK